LNDTEAGAPTTPDITTPAFQRFASVDVARGIIMIVMALDHASVAWNSGRSMYEAALPPIDTVTYTSLAQQIAREVTHICAPGFQLLAGMGLAISVLRRQAARVREWRISGDMILRAAVLFFCEWVLLREAFGGISFFFVVLCCIGSSMILFAFARFLPLPLIALGSLTVLLSAPTYCPTEIVDATGAGYLRNVLTNIALGDPLPPAWAVMYPILPWAGFFGLGWFLGILYHRRADARFKWVTWVGLLLLAAGVLIRWFGGSYGDRVPGGDAGPWSASFWILAKYPPTPAFSVITLGALVLLLGVLRPLDRGEELARPWRIVAVFGQVALFFFVTHVYVYGVYPFLTDTLAQYSLATTCVAWLGGLVVLWPICVWYGRLRKRYRRVLRYF
jgi:uncharacterized membrane protein